MIRFENLSKIFKTGQGQDKVVLSESNFVFPAGHKIGLLGRNGTGKSTVLKMIAGTQDPNSGRILRTGSVSWPIGYAGSFHRELTGAQNTRFIARVYGVDTDSLCAFVRDFSELGRYFDMPLKSYSSGMRARLAFGVSMGIPFETYLIDEITSVGDARFRKKCLDVFQNKLEGASAIMVTHSLKMVRDICDRVAVLESGRLHLFEDVHEGITFHQSNLEYA